jgi:hypothetical protein
MCATPHSTRRSRASPTFGPIRNGRIELTLSAMLKMPHLGSRCAYPVVVSMAREFLNTSDKERSGVLPTLMPFLGLYRDRVVARVGDNAIGASATKPPVRLRSLVVPP